MADKIPVLVPERPAEPDVYRPLSMLALAAILVGGGYAVLMTLVTLVAFFKGFTLFLGLWTLFFPVLGALLAYAGSQHIQRSEGVLGGLALTTWAWRLSVFFGLGYVAYYGATYLAVSLQAENFTKEWFEKIHQGKINHAFLETIEPAKRKSDQPFVDDAEHMFSRYGMSIGRRKGPLIGFQELDVVRLLQEEGPDVQIKSQGVKSLEFEKGGFQVVLTYQLTTPEGVFDYQLM